MSNLGAGLKAQSWGNIPLNLDVGRFVETNFR